MLKLEGMSTANIVLIQQGSTELPRCEHCVFFIPVNILTGVARRVLGPLDTPSYSPTHGEFGNLCFISVAPMVHVSSEFVYKAVYVNKTIAISSTKPPSYAYAQVTARQKPYLG